MASSLVWWSSKALLGGYVGIASMFRMPGGIVRRGACDALPRERQGIIAGLLFA
jgi:hypothetical protein